MYTKDGFNKYYVVGKAIAEPIHVDIDLHSCETIFYSDADGNMTGFIYPIEGLSGETFGLFVSDARHKYLHDGKGDINCTDDRFDNRCWYIGYDDYVKYKKVSHSFKV